MMKIIILILIIFFNLEAKEQRVLSHKTYEGIAVVQKFLQDNNNSKALIEIKKLSEKANNNRVQNYEKAFIDRMYAYVYISNEKYTKAIEHFQKAYKYNIFIPKENLNILKNIAGLYMTELNYKSAIDYYSKYIKENKNEDEDFEVYISISSAYNELGDNTKAIKYVNLAIDNSKFPKKSWFDMLLALHYSANDYKKSIQVQEELIKRFGVSREYLFTLSGLYQYVENELESLNSLEMAYNMGYFKKEDDYFRLAYMFLNLELPHKSALLMKEAIKNKRLLKTKESLRLLADSYSYAKDDKKALKIYIELAKLSKNGDVYAQIGQSYLNLEEFSNAVKYFDKAILSEILKDKANVYLLLGITHFELNDKAKAKVNFLNAQKFPNTFKVATEWISYVDNKKEK